MLSRARGNLANTSEKGKTECRGPGVSEARTRGKDRYRSAAASGSPDSLTPAALASARLGRAQCPGDPDTT